MCARRPRPRLHADKSFVWLRRNLTPRQQFEVNRLGIPGLDFEQEERRVYPHGHLAGHIVGFTDVDNVGLAGIEKSMDAAIAGAEIPLQLSLDIRVQQILRQELSSQIEKFKAIGGGGIVLGIAAGVPGPAFLGPSYRSGVVIATVWDGGSEYLGNVLAHEIGHYLGLYHTTEKAGTHDTLMDTEIDDGANLMFWAYSAEQLELSDHQSWVARSHPMVIGDEIKIRKMMYLALSYDHRIVDGREAVTFLVRLKECIEDPQRLLIDV